MTQPQRWLGRPPVRETADDRVHGLAGPRGADPFQTDVVPPGHPGEMGPARPPKDLRYPKQPPRVEARKLVCGTNDAHSLGFPAHGVIIDNYSVSWLYVAAADRYVPPDVVDYRMNLLVGTTVSSLKWEAPPGRTQPAVDATQIAHVWWVEGPVQGASGTSYSL